MRALLPILPRPSRYAGIEEGACHKDPAQVRLRVGLAFPDTYEVGMSYLGQKILYGIVNSHEHWWAERVMAPEREAGDILRQHGCPLGTLESGTPLRDLHCLSFSITHELCYTNVLYMLELGNIPLRTADRPQDLRQCPLVIAGGGALLSAEPLAPFIDLMVLGDGEESLPDVLRLLEQDGFTVHRRGKTISISAEGWGNNVRFDRLGDGYTLDDLLAVLSGQKEHTPRKKTAVQAAPPKVNLLVDIQSKLKAGKGAGYACWAKVFNLKQMAQTLNYLSEHGLLDYADLATKTAEATIRYNALSSEIKAAEKRMAEIAVLRTHIVNYAKTRETYVAYRKAGYSRKFYAEHEDEIRLHQAAKEAFNELNVKKLPTIKELQTEYAQLLADKKKAYGEYRQARAAMRELLTVKNNVDRVLAMEQTEPQQKEKDHGQR